MRADNHGEGGILALLALVRRERRAKARRASALLVLVGLFGAALLYGDGMITPAISVLGAVEGLEVATPRFEPLRRADHVRDPRRRCSLVQRRGTARHRRGRSARSCCSGSSTHRARSGVPQIVRAPGGARARSTRATRVALLRRTTACTASCVLGSVVLVRHRRRGALRRHGPLRQAADPPRLVRASCCPALLLNYFGQGALLLARPERGASNPFFALVAELGAATRWSCSRRAATVIASQALISGAFSLTQPGGAARLLPARRRSCTPRARPRARSTSPRSTGLLMRRAASRSCSAFRASSRARRGVRHRGHRHDGASRTILYFVVARQTVGLVARSRRSPLLCLAVLAIDLALLRRQRRKIADGGWFPLVGRPRHVHDHDHLVARPPRARVGDREPLVSSDEEFLDCLSTPRDRFAHQGHRRVHDVDRRARTPEVLEAPRA